MRERVFKLMFIAMVFALPLHVERAEKDRARLEAQRRRLAGETQVPQSASASEEYLVTGHGAPREGYENCNRSLPAFAKLLAKRGIHVIERMSCASLDINAESFVPRFRAKAKYGMTTRLELGGRFSSQAYCEAERHRFVERMGGKAEVLESSCKRSLVSGHGDYTDEVYEPAAVVLGVAKYGEAQVYNSVETLVKSADEARLKALGQPN